MDLESGKNRHGNEKKEKMDFNNLLLMRSTERPLSFHGNTQNKRHISSKINKTLHRRSIPNSDTKKFDVRELDTNLPRIDLDAIELHLNRDRDIDRKRRSDREEIRRRLADSSNPEENDSKSRKNLQSRLQSSMNLQICFMNETASDDSNESSPDTTDKIDEHQNKKGCDLVKKQSRLQSEARHALAQAKDLARLQIAQARLSGSVSPISEMVRNSLNKVGVTLPSDRRRVSRQLLTEMNVNQLQVIVNDLHSHIELLNERLVLMLLDRDDLHMEQDSILVDIEDLTRYL